ncbi:hypothetical protein IM816_01245 [Luteibacter flocculans]|uniref:Uncharacterized protein n=1 Tax=Luteibacter flocculans TaxID=2780091 RepID=A0ABY4T1F5_9GAMM|nr:hypothetical protein [Luteibacter flocculans]URL58781.1 hypothetical protein IM816_01245 [Luteibacter flocculans]
MKTILTSLAALSAVIAALLWYKASASEVPYEPNRPGDKSAVVFYNGDHRWDVIRTAELQTKRNKRAALAASIAAVLQAIALVASDN